MPAWGRAISNLYCRCIRPDIHYAVCNSLVKRSIIEKAEQSTHTKKSSNTKKPKPLSNLTIVVLALHGKKLYLQTEQKEMSVLHDATVFSKEKYIKILKRLTINFILQANMPMGCNDGKKNQIW